MQPLQHLFCQKTAIDLPCKTHLSLLLNTKSFCQFLYQGTEKLCAPEETHGPRLIVGRAQEDFTGQLK